jgi:hypothetical protein
MANISFFYPDRKKGFALGLNAAGGNIGVSNVQLLVPLIIGWSALYGAVLGLAIAGPENDQGDAGGGAVLGAVGGAGAGALAAWWLTRRRDLTPGQGQALISGGTWGTYTVAMLGDAFSGVDSSSTNDIFKSMAIGGALGVGGGYLWARSKPSEGDVSLVNSLGAYGSIPGCSWARSSSRRRRGLLDQRRGRRRRGLAVGLFAANRTTSAPPHARIDPSHRWRRVAGRHLPGARRRHHQRRRAGRGRDPIFPWWPAATWAGASPAAWTGRRRHGRRRARRHRPPPDDIDDGDFGGTTGLSARPQPLGAGRTAAAPVQNQVLGPRLRHRGRRSAVGPFLSGSARF